MPENPWQQQFQRLLARASEEFKKTGEELKVEAQRLLGEVRDPANQQKVKEGLRDIGTWAKKAADQAAEAMESAVKKAETTWKKAAKEDVTPTNPIPPVAEPSSKAAPKGSIPKPILVKPGSPAAKKTVGKKKSSASPAPKTAKPAGKPAKSIGKKKPKAS